MRLELTRRGDYAVRAMLALAERATTMPTSAREIAAEMDIPVGFLPRVMVDLVGAGLAASVTGRTGGYVLARPATDITLLDVIDGIEGDSRRTSCVLRGGPCGRDGHCQVHDVFFAAQDALLSRLRDVTLADLVTTPEPRHDRTTTSPRRRPRS